MLKAEKRGVVSTFLSQRGSGASSEQVVTHPRLSTLSSSDDDETELVSGHCGGSDAMSSSRTL